VALIASYEQNNPRLMQAWAGYTKGIGEQEIDPEGSVGARFWYKDADTRDRLKRYLKNEKLMDVTQHHKLFVRDSADQAPTPGDWIPVDFPGMLARLMRHYAIGPEFGVSAKVSGTDTEVQRIFEEGEVVDRLRQACEALPEFGDAVFRIDLEESETDDGEFVPQAVFKFIHPGCYHPVFDAVDPTKVLSVTLAYVHILPDEKRRDPNIAYVVLKEHHTLEVGEDLRPHGQVRYEAVEWDGQRESEPIPAALMHELFPGVEDAPTGIDEIPIIHVPFNAEGGCPWGRSEFSRISRLFLAMENRLTQEDEILERHARPKLIVGPGVIGPDARANLADFDVIEIDPSVLERAVKPEYLTWDPKIDAVKHELETLMEFFFMTTETSLASFGMERSGSQVESARALRFKSHRTVSKVQDLRDKLSHAIKRMFRIAQKLELAGRAEEGLDAYKRSPILIQWPDPIIEDHTQDATDYSLLRTSGLVSRIRAIKDIFNLSADEAARELALIQLDELTEAVLPPRQTENPRTAGEQVPGLPASQQPVSPSAVPGKAPSVTAGRAPSPAPVRPADAPAPKR
jgi:hypothetical protein